MNKKEELVYFPSWTAGRGGYARRVNGVFSEYLRRKGLILTEQRKAILGLLLEADRHLAQDEIYSALKSRGIGKVTVFRTLKLLEACRLVEKVTSPGASPRFEIEIDRPHHNHLVCVVCGKITEVQWPEVEKIQDRTCKEAGFEVLSHRHEVYGRCKGCYVK